MLADKNFCCTTDGVFELSVAYLSNFFLQGIDTLSKTRKIGFETDHLIIYQR